MYAKVNENKDLWMRLEIEDYNPHLIVHILPANEKMQHMQDFCPCDPEIKQIEGGYQIEHKAFDGRDVLDDVILGVN